MVNKKAQGFTLVEILIALSVLAIVMLVFGTGIKLAAKSWVKQASDFNLEQVVFKFYSRLNKKIRNAVEIKIDDSNLFLKDDNYCYIYQFKDHSLWFKKMDINGFEAEGSWPEPISNYTFDKVVKLTSKKVIKSLNYNNNETGKYEVNIELAVYNDDGDIKDIDNDGEISDEIKTVSRTFYNHN